MSDRRVLIVDDELSLAPAAAQFTRVFRPDGFQFVYAASGEHALRRLGSGELFAILLLDMRFAGVSSEHGLEILTELQARYPRLPVVVMSSRRDPEILIRAWDLGARSYLVKWSDNPDFSRELAAKLEQHARYDPPQKLLGDSESIRRVRELAATAAQYDVSVLVEGETGTGKELVAELIHEQSPRSEKVLAKVNCGAISEGLVESELFGHAKGAFTGAVADKKGHIESAEGGVLFLDEVSELSPHTQQALLRFLDRKEIMRVGTTQVRHADVRVVAATNRPLRQLVGDGSFREDLYHRLNQFPIRTPPLRELGADLVLLAEHFLELNRNQHRKPVAGFTEEVLAFFARHRWPGNARELNNVVTRAYLMTPSGAIGLGSLPEEVVAADGAVVGTQTAEAGVPERVDLDEHLSREAWRVIREVTEDEKRHGAHGLRRRVAERIGVHPANGVGRTLDRIRRLCPDLSPEIDRVFG